jgi:hypothetical protein
MLSLIFKSKILILILLIYRKLYMKQKLCVYLIKINQIILKKLILIKGKIF